jgi:hypothetical protein
MSRQTFSFTKILSFESELKDTFDNVGRLNKALKEPSMRDPRFNGGNGLAFVGAFSQNVDKALEELILLKELFTVLPKSLS